METPINPQLLTYASLEGIEMQHDNKRQRVEPPRTQTGNNMDKEDLKAALLQKIEANKQGGKRNASSVQPNTKLSAPKAFSTQNSNQQKPFAALAMSPLFRRSPPKRTVVEVESIDGFSITCSNTRITPELLKSNQPTQTQPMQLTKHNTAADRKSKELRSPEPTTAENGEPDIMCEVCSRGDNEEVLILCDKCGKGWHIYCHPKELLEVPVNAWLCFKCSEKLTTKLLAITASLKKHKNSDPFMFPVDPVNDEAPDYYEVVKNPMDLSKVEQKLRSGEYERISHTSELDIEQLFEQDVRLIFSNCRYYNEDADSPIIEMCNSVEEHFDRLLEKLKAKKGVTTSNK